MLILERPWTRQPQGAVRAVAGNNIVALWNTASPGGIVYDAAGGYHAPSGGFLTPSDRGIILAGARGRGRVTTASLPERATGGAYLLAAWINPEFASGVDADAWLSCGVESASPYSASCTIYTGGGGGAGGIYVGTYGNDIKSASTGIVPVGKWSQIATIYNGGPIKTSSGDTTSLVASRPTFLNGTQITMSGITPSVSAAPQYPSLLSAPGRIGDSPSGVYGARGKIGPCVIAFGSYSELLEIVRQHYENPYALLRYRRIHIPTASAPSAPTITALSAIGITATSAQPRISYS